MEIKENHFRGVFGCQGCLYLLRSYNGKEKRRIKKGEDEPKQRKRWLKQFLLSPLQVGACTLQTCALVSPGAWCQAGNHLTSFFILQKAEATGEKRPRGRPRKWVSNKKPFILLSSNEKFLFFQMKVTFTFSVSNFRCHESLKGLRGAKDYHHSLPVGSRSWFRTLLFPLGVTPFSISYQHEKSLPSSFKSGNNGMTCSVGCVTKVKGYYETLEVDYKWW